MKRVLKIVGVSLLGLILISLVGGGIFVYRIVNGLPFYESQPAELPADLSDFSILVFNKTNGFRHGKAIGAATQALEALALKEGWGIYVTESGGVFNPEQLAQFDVVVWNNVTGKVLRSEQRKAFQTYIEAGGGFIGIHGAGDFSHHWEWYESELIGAHFSHHTMNPGVQEANMYKACDSTYQLNCLELPGTLTRKDEWYVFYDNPRDNGAKVLYTVDEHTFDPNGNFLFLVTNKDFGMGEDHPIIWYRELPAGGRAFYSALGHTAESFEDEVHREILRAAIKWAGRGEG